MFSQSDCMARSVDDNSGSLVLNSVYPLWNLRLSAQTWPHLKIVYTSSLIDCIGAKPSEAAMTVAKIIEITCSSSTSFEDAIQKGIAKANETLKNVKSAWVADQNLNVENGRVTDYHVRLKVTFVLD